MFRKGGHSSAFLLKKEASNTTRKIHTTFPDGAELVEEYDEETHRILTRKRRRPTTTGAAGTWELLLGDEAKQPAAAAAAAAGGGGLMLHESSANPHCVRADTPGCFTWTISNMRYPGDTYSVRLDAEGPSIIVSTTNKKYYKRLPLLEMQLLHLAAEPSRLSWSHSRSTLTIHYVKPPALLAEELADAKAAAAMRVQEPSADCRQQ